MSITIDLSYLQTITRGDKAFEKTLLTGSIADIDTKMQAIQIAWQNKDAAGVRQYAHSLVSLCAIAGMPELEKLTRSLDQLFVDRVFHGDQEALYQSVLTGWQSGKEQLQTIVSTY
ncbi:MAG: Hpt domain-containing protein [Ferruginibacter sp.]